MTVSFQKMTIGKPFNFGTPAWIVLVILVFALGFRVWDLSEKPPHFDEGVNGWFADQMAFTGFYDYDPTNFHGPLHFYAVFVSQTLFGRNLWALRLPAVIASLACVVLVLGFRRFLPDAAVRWAALAMAVSPAFVFYGRYSIHESWLVFFLLLATWGIFELWKNGTRAGLFAVAGALAGMVLTKETFIIHVGAFLLAVPCLLLWNRLVPCRPSVDPMARQQWRWWDLVLGVAGAVFLIIFFYSGTFLNWSGVVGLGQTFAAWFETGMNEAGGHEKTTHQLGPVNWYWLAMMARYEWPALAGVLVCFRCLWPTPVFVRYLAIFGGGVLLAYSIIPYKTPWLIISILWPFYFLFGWMITELRAGGQIWRWAATGVAGVLIVVSAVSAARLNFWHATDPREPYVYVQTFPEIEELTGPLLRRAEADPTTFRLRGQLFLSSYYPLPWMLGEFTGIGYFGEVDDLPRLDGDFIATTRDRTDEFEALLVGDYYRRDFRLRDSYDECVAWFRADVFAEQFEGEPEVRNPK